MDQKNDYYICSDHQNYCTLVCINPQCVFKPLCEACVSKHYPHHMSEIVPLDQILQKKMIMPTIFSQAFHKLKQTLFSLQMQLNNKRIENLKRLLIFCESLKGTFDEFLKDFNAKGNRLINQTYESFPSEISELLQKINNHEIAFDPNLNSPFFSSQRVENSMKFQSHYRQQLFPNLEEEVKFLEKNIEGSFCEVNQEKILPELNKFLDSFFKKHDFFNISKIKKAFIPKSEKKQPQQTSFFKDDSLVKSAIISQNKNQIIDPYPDLWTLKPQKTNNNWLTNTNKNINTNKNTIETSLKKLNQSPYKHLSNPQSDFGSVSLLGSHTDMVNTLCVIPYTNWLFSGGGDKIIKQWDYKTCYLLKEFKGHLADIWSLVYIGEENFIASSSSDKTIKLWNILQGNCIKTLVGHLGVVRCLIFDYEQKNLISGGTDQTIKIWDIYAGVCKETIKGHDNIVRCLCWMGKMRKLISGGGDGCIRIWDFNTIERNVQSLISHTGEIWSIIYIEEMEIMVSCGTDRMIRIWNCEQWKIMKILIGHHNIVNKVIYLKDQKRILSSGSDLVMKLWNIHSGQNIRSFNEHEDVVADMVFVDGVIITASWDRNIKKWELFE